MLHQLVSTMEEALDIGEREMAALTNGNSLGDINEIDLALERKLALKTVRLKDYTYMRVTVRLPRLGKESGNSKSSSPECRLSERHRSWPQH